MSAKLEGHMGRIDVASLDSSMKKYYRDMYFAGKERNTQSTKKRVTVQTIFPVLENSMVKFTPQKNLCEL
jgi:hypothetical protein